MYAMEVSKELIATPKDLGRKIREARQRSDKTVTQLAYESEMTAAYWYQVESEGVKKLPYETLVRMQTALGVEFEVSFDE